MGTIRIKGKAPQYDYGCSLSQVFQQFGTQVFSVDECVSFAETRGFCVSKDQLVRTLFRYRGRARKQPVEDLAFRFAGPFQMKSVVDSLFRFNLRYQDAVIKIELEKDEETKKALTAPKARSDLLKGILEVVSVVLRTGFFAEEPVFLELTNSELDSIVLGLLSLLGVDSLGAPQPESLLSTGFLANEIAGIVQERVLSTKHKGLAHILPFVLYSGVVWWSDAGIQRGYEESPGEVVLGLQERLMELVNCGLAINDYSSFRSEIVEAAEHKDLLYFLDDNGELVWDLLLIKLLLDSNPRLRVSCIVNELPVANNANVVTLQRYLDRAPQLDLEENERFSLFAESSELPAIDPRFASHGLRKRILQADAILVKGVSFFEKLQYLPVPTYYLFTVYSDTSRMLTGLERYDAVFARLGPHLCSFSHLESRGDGAAAAMTLVEMHKALQTSAYRELLARFCTEAEANRSIRARALETNTPISVCIGQWDGNRGSCISGAPSR